MKTLEKMTLDELESAYEAAIRNLSGRTIIAIRNDPSPKEGDGSQLSHAKAVYRQVKILQDYAKRFEAYHSDPYHLAEKR